MGYTARELIENIASAKSGYNVPMAEKDEWLKFRISKVEKAEMGKAAKRMGLSLSGWIRMNLLAALHAGNKKERKAP